jgi:hypothetical protein
MRACGVTKAPLCFLPQDERIAQLDDLWRVFAGVQRAEKDDRDAGAVQIAVDRGGLAAGCC